MQSKVNVDGAHATHCMHDSSIVSSIVGQNTVHTVCKANQLC